MTGRELWLISQAHNSGQLSGDGLFTKKCHDWLEKYLNCHKALLTHSCTAALEMTAILADLIPGDEVIMPSYTFVSTANAFVLRGAIPVFVDIHPDTLNLDETLVESAITSRTRAIVAVHYAGVGCNMEALQLLSEKYDLILVEDAAQAMLSTYNDRPLGSYGHLACFSFHETKNIISGEGGALIINDEKFVKRAEVIREKGTNRSQFFRGQVDKYTWVDVGSSFLPGEIVAAFLYAQLEEASNIINKRVSIWEYYHSLLGSIEQTGKLRRPIIPDLCKHNGHMYYVLVEDLETRTAMIKFLKEKGINSVFHYVPLHDSPAGKLFGRINGELHYTSSLPNRLLRLPLFPDLTFTQVEYIVDSIGDFFR